MRSHPDRPKRAWVAYAWVAGVAWILPLVGFHVLHELLPDYNANGQCEGIGFGCTLTPADTVDLLRIITYPVLFVAGIVAMTWIAARRARSSRRR